MIKMSEEYWTFMKGSENASLKAGTKLGGQTFQIGERFMTEVHIINPADKSSSSPIMTFKLPNVQLVHKNVLAARK